MVRASTRSKTAASTAAASVKQPSPKKKAVSPSNAKTPPVPKAKPATKAKAARKPTRTSTRGRKDAEMAEQVEEEQEVEDVAVLEVDDSQEIMADLPPDQPDPGPSTPLEDVVDPPDAPRSPSLPREESGSTYCICKGRDDGSPMITCEACENWYHFGCVSITQAEADEIATFVCPSCTETTGKSTTMKWEVLSDEDKGKEILQETQDQEEPLILKSPSESGLAPDVDGSSPEPSEDEDYVDDYRLAKLNQRKSSTRRPARQSSESRSPSPPSPVSPSGRKRKPTTRLLDSGKNTSFLKRKSTNASAPDLVELPPPPSKKSKAERRGSKSSPTKPEKSATDDPTRKYCLGKLKDVVIPIFLQYSAKPEDHPVDGVDVSKAQEEDVDEAGRVKLAEEKATQFVEELEACVFEVYSEPDKKGQKIVGPKYKERFRTLTFNLEKPDRTELRSRIAQGQITPEELSQMSSTDLANEKIQQEIESARLASLKDSILEVKVGVPRAKITHKGEEMIEDESGNNAFHEARVPEDHPPSGGSGDETQEDEPSSALDGAINVGSPMEEMHSGQSSEPAAGFDISEVLGDMGLPSDGPTATSMKPPPISIPSTSYSHHGSPVTARSSSFSMSAGPKSSNAVLASALLSASQTPAFDLEAVWGGTSEASNTILGLGPTDLVGGPDAAVGDVGVAIGDNDFDMFFDRGEMFEPSEEPDAMQVDTSYPNAAQSTAQDDMAEYEALPTVWNGKVQMPVDVTMAWTSSVKARQIGGRSLGTSEFVWQKLFTQPISRIDGRVPVEASNKYLVDTRLNPSKELIAVALSPLDTSDEEFNKMFDFLVGKRRHALVFPWAGLPPELAVGKDFYLVPFAPQDHTPEFIELLDDVKLPRRRSSRMLLGVFVLQKDRLHVPTAAPLAGISLAPGPPTMASLAAMLPGGLTEEGKNLLQTLMTSGNISAVAAGLVPAAPPPALPPSGQMAPPGGVIPQGFVALPQSTFPAPGSGVYPPPSGIQAPPSNYSGMHQYPSYASPPGPPRGPSHQPGHGYRRSPSPERRRYSDDYSRSPSNRYGGDQSPRQGDEWRRGSSGWGNRGGGRGGPARGSDGGWRGRGGR